MEKVFRSFGENFRDVERRTAGRDGNTSAVAGCINTEFCLSTPEEINNGILTMVFMDMQPLDSVYPPETALQNGTLFPNIDKPFCGGMYR